MTHLRLCAATGTGSLILRKSSSHCLQHCQQCSTQPIAAPTFLGLPQDVQGWTYDYPVSFFEKRIHRIRRIAPDDAEIEAAAKLLSSAARPMIIAGGGVQYSRAVEELTAFAEAHQIPVVETIAGRANLIATHPLNTGPIGVTGSDSANSIAEKADVVLSCGYSSSGFHHGLLDGLCKGRPNYLAQCGTP